MAIYLNHASLGKPVSTRSSGWANALGLILFVLMCWAGVFALLP